MTKTRKLAYLTLIGNVVIWGAALPIVKPALVFITPYYFLKLRYLVASIFLIPLLFFIWPEKNALKSLKLIIPIEIIQVIFSLTFLYQGLEYTPALTASLIGSTAPIFVTLGGIFLLKEKEEKREWLGLGISLLGTLLVLITSTQINHIYPQNPKGILFLSLYLLCNTIYLLLVRKKYTHQNQLFITAISTIVGLIGFSILAPLLGPTPPVYHLINELSVVRAVLYMGILGTPIALSLLLYGHTKIEASEASLFTYLQPLVYIPLSIFWLGDRLYPTQFFGLILVVLGVFLAEIRPRHRHRQLTSSA